MIQLGNITSGYSTGKINENFQKIQREFNEKTLRRDGLENGEPNQMEVDLDMNSKDILNVGRINAKEIGLDGFLIQEALDGKVDKVAGKQLSDENFTQALKDKLESLAPGSGGIESIIAGSGITVDDSDPVNPVVSATGGGGGGIDSIVAGNGINVDDSDPANPVVSVTSSDGTEVNVQTSTAYTLVLTDAFKMVTMDNDDPNTITVPPNTSVEFPANTRIDLGQDGSGQTTIVAGIGVTIRTPETLKLRKQWSKASLIRRAADVWDIVGDLEAAP